MRVFYTGQQTSMDVGNMDEIFQRLKCSLNTKNYRNSYKTFISLDGFMFGIINIIGNFGTVFVDQVSYSTFLLDFLDIKEF